MSSLELLQLALKAITDAAQQSLTDAAKHPSSLELDHKNQSAAMQVSIRQPDGVKVKTYKVSVVLVEEF